MSAIPSMSGRVLIAAGGTGGHVYPALAVAGLLTEQGWSVDWVGTERGIEQRLVPAAGLPLHRLSVSGLRGKNWVARVQGAVRLIAALWQSLSLMWRVKPDVVLGMGGYAAGPAGLAAWLTRRPLVIHEQNSVAGTTNRWLAPLARRVLCGLPGGFAADRNAEVVGNPVRQTLTPVDRGELTQLASCVSSPRSTGVSVWRTGFPTTSALRSAANPPGNPHNTRRASGANQRLVVPATEFCS